MRLQVKKLRGLRNYLYMILLCLCAIQIKAQDITLASQTDVNAFDTTLTVLQGSLYIHEALFSTDPIVDLSNLRGLDSITEYFSIFGCHQLASLDGLSGLSFVGTILTIGNNDSLLNLEGFSNLETARGINIQLNKNLNTTAGFPKLHNLYSLVVDSNPTLVDVSGFDILSTTTIVEILGNWVLHDLTGLSSVDSIYHLRIEDNLALEHLNGLSNLTSLSELIIYQNPKLTNLNAFQHISDIELILMLNNLMLENLNGFSSISKIHRSLNITHHPNLANIDGLFHLDSVGIDFWITDNPLLISCCAVIPLLENPSNVGGNITILRNGPNCSSPEEIITYGCEGSKVAEGYFRIDFDSNGCDTVDIGYNNFVLNVTNSTGSSQYIANNNSNYQVLLQDGVNTIVPILPSNKLAISPDTLILNWPADSLDSTVNFCVSILEDYNDLEVSIIPINQARPGFNATYIIQFENNGTTALSGNLQFAFPYLTTTLESALPAPNQITQGILSWDFTDLQPLELSSIELTLKLNTPSDLSPLNAGDVLSYIAMIEPTNDDENAIDNTFSLNQTVINSFDPNDKSCLQGKYLNPEMIGEYMHYMIRFENNGTANAIHVEISDSIDVDKFNIHTLNVTASSHNCVTNVKGNVVTFSFDFINLQYSDDLNDGFVSFKIKTRDDLVIGDALTNNADIYFDFNLPIRTNTTHTDISYLSTEAIPSLEYELALYPNPATEILIVDLGYDQHYTIRLIGLNGNFLEVHNSYGSTQFDINTTHLPEGLYFIHVTADDGSIRSSKFIKIAY